MTISKTHPKSSAVNPAASSSPLPSSPSVSPSKTEIDFDAKRFRDLTSFSRSGSVSIVARVYPHSGLVPQATAQLERTLEYIDGNDPRLTSEGGWLEQALKLGV